MSYARAFLEILDQDPKCGEKALQGLLRLIRKSGDWPRRHKIVEACEQAWRMKNDRPLVVIESARPLGEAGLAHLKKNFPGSYDFKEVIRPELIAGARVSINKEIEIDGSLSRVLKQIFAD